MRMIIFPVLLFLVLLAGALPAQFEEPMRQHHAHVHGEASGNLALDASVLRLELDIPADNLVGFEHAPLTADQQTLLDDTVASLEQLAWLNLDTRGQCQAHSIDVRIVGMAAGSDNDQHDRQDHAFPHDQDHDHDHGHENHKHDQHDHDHGSFHLVAQFVCAAAPSLGWLEIDLFSNYPANQTLRLDVLTERRVDRVELGSRRTRIVLTDR